MINVGLLPLDSRPCNTLWLDELASLANMHIVSFPRSECGDLFKGANLDKILLWLKKVASKLNYLIISTDAFAFGGLIQARKALVDYEKVRRAISIFKEIKKANKDLKIYVFDTVMRTSITALNSEDEKYWKLMNDYSYYKGKVYFFNKEEDKEKLTNLEKVIPSSIIATYLNARQVKLKITELFLELLKDGFIEDIILLQEDSMPYGIQAIDQEKLLKNINDYGISNRVQFYNGTDEGALVLLAKIIVLENKMNIKFYIHSPSKVALEKVCLFEDHPCIDNIEKMAETIGLKITNKDDADFILSIYITPENTSFDLVKDYRININKDASYNNYISQLNNYLEQGKKVVFVDLLYPNGGSPIILEDIDYQKLSGYSAWNTASNSLGSAFCQIVAYLSSANNQLNEVFLKERVLDDCIYQSVVRGKVSASLLSEGINIYNLGAKAPIVTESVKKELNKYSYLVGGSSYTVSLPWKRMFEVEIKIEK